MIPYGSPVWASSCCSDVKPFTVMVAVRLEQKTSTYLTSASGMPLALSLWSNLSLETPLYAPLTSKLIRLSTFPLLHAL